MIERQMKSSALDSDPPPGLGASGMPQAGAGTCRSYEHMSSSPAVSWNCAIPAGDSRARASFAGDSREELAIVFQRLWQREYGFRSAMAQEASNSTTSILIDA